MALVHDAVRERKVIGVVTQRDPAVDDPVESDLFRVGTLTHIHKMFKFPDGSLRLVVQGVQRFRLRQVHQYRPFLKAQHRAAARRPCPPDQEVEVRALAQSAQGLFQRVVELSPTLSDELQALAANIQEPGAPRRLRRRQPAQPHHRRRSRRCWRPSTCARAWTA